MVDIKKAIQVQAAMAARSMIPLHLQGRQYSLDDVTDPFLFEGPNIFPSPMEVLPQQLTKDRDGYTESLHAQADAKRPIIDAAEAKRERKRLKRARDTK